MSRGELLATLESGPTRRELLVSRARLATARAEASRASLELAQARERAVRAATVTSYLNPDEASATVYAAKLAAARKQASDGQVMEQKARVEQLLAQLADCEIKAPADGIVADRLLDSGAVVDRRSVVLRLVASEAPRVRFAVPEEAAREVVPGLAVRIEASAFRLLLTGRIQSVAPQIDPASRTLLAEAVLDSVPTGVGSIATGAMVRVFPVPRDQPSGKLGLLAP